MECLSTASVVTYSVCSCARQQNTPGVSFRMLFDPRNLKTKTLCHPNVTIVMAPGVGGGRGATGRGGGWLESKGPL